MIYLFDATNDPWTAHIDPTINPVPSDAYLVANTPDGLSTVNVASKEMAGGLVSANYPIQPGSKFFGQDVTWIETPEDMPHKSRNEMDVKVTIYPGTPNPLPNQANGSLQWNVTRQMWQLDPTGKSWVDSGFSQPPVLGENTMKLRATCDGRTWSVTGLNLNGTAFAPGAQFQNLPLISTNWAGMTMHSQMQCECINVPWFLRTTYPRILVMCSATPIAM